MSIINEVVLIEKRWIQQNAQADAMMMRLVEEEEAEQREKEKTPKSKKQNKSLKSKQLFLIAIKVRSSFLIRKTSQ